MAEGDNAPASGRLIPPAAAGVPLPGVQSHPTFTQAPSHNAVTAEEHALQAPVSSITNVARDGQISSMQAQARTIQQQPHPTTDRNTATMHRTVYKIVARPQIGLGNAEPRDRRLEEEPSVPQLRQNPRRNTRANCPK
jgi:hypothetical protein